MSLLRIYLAILLALFLSSAHCVDDKFWGRKRSGGAVLPRSVAPAFTANAVVEEEFKQLSLSDYKGKWLVLLFYPFDFTFVCPTEVGMEIDCTPRIRCVFCWHS